MTHSDSELVNKVKDINHMFSDCSSLTSLNLSNINTNNVKDMGAMFYDSSSLSSLNTKDERILDEWKNQCFIILSFFLNFYLIFLI